MTSRIRIKVSQLLASSPPGFGGFTLVELMVTISVISIFAVIGVPSYRNLIATHRVKAASADIYMELVRARAEAIKRNQNVTVTPGSAHWEAGWSIPDPSNSGYSITAHGAIPGITIRAQNLTDDPAAVVYQSSGRVMVAAGGSAPYFVIASTSVTSTKSCISVDLSGRPYTATGVSC